MKLYENNQILYWNEKDLHMYPSSHVHFVAWTRQGLWSIQFLTACYCESNHASARVAAVIVVTYLYAYVWTYPQHLTVTIEQNCLVIRKQWCECPSTRFSSLGRMLKKQNRMACVNHIFDMFRTLNKNFLRILICTDQWFRRYVWIYERFETKSKFWRWR